MNDKILAIDCSNRFTCIGLVDGQRRISEINLDLGRSQASQLPLCVDFILKSSGVSLREIDFIAATVGPGYFTGIRVALSYGVSLAKSLGVPVIPISSLETLARAARPVLKDVVIPCIRAGQEAIYCAGFLAEESGLKEIFSEGEVNPDEFSSALSRIGERVRVVATEERTHVGFSLSVEPENITCIGGFALGETALLHRAEARPPHEVQARYYRSPGLGSFSK